MRRMRDDDGVKYVNISSRISFYMRKRKFMTGRLSISFGMRSAPSGPIEWVG